MLIGMIWAESKNHVIGVNNALPWHLPEDLKHFQEVTKNQAVIMGRKTWESLPERFRPLPDRLNIVVSREFHENGVNTMWVSSVQDALLVARSSGVQEVWFIGGAMLYNEALPFVNILQRTVVNVEVEGDVFMPIIDEKFVLVSSSDEMVSKTGLGYVFETYLTL